MYFLSQGAALVIGWIGGGVLAAANLRFFLFFVVDCRRGASKIID